MASALMIDDRLQIDGYNPAVMVGSFGMLRDGFPKDMGPDGTYTCQIDERPTEYPEPPIGSNDLGMDTSGAMYLKTAQPNPAPFQGFPARKLEYSDGTVTWYRPGAPWPWAGGAAGNDGYTAKLIKTERNQSVLFWLALFAFVLFIFTRLRKS